MTEAVAWLYTAPNGNRGLHLFRADEATRQAAINQGWTETPLYPAEALAAKDAKIAEWRRDEVQAIGAAISTRNWQALERSYNSLRDKMDRHAIEALKEKNDVA